MKLLCQALIIVLSMLSTTLCAKTIVILMDGTWNEPEYEENGEFPQGDSTNVEKLRYLLSHSDQEIHYFRGIGTDGKQVHRVVDGAFGKTAEKRVDDAYERLSRSYESGDELAIFGFSRGAATSRILARRIRKDGVKGDLPVIRFMGLWDTVASLGVPVPKLSEFRKMYHDADARLRIPDNVEHVVHLVSIDEDRSLFVPTLISLDSSETKVDEAWFAGNHGDVGGGWVKESDDELQLAAITLGYMIRQADLHEIQFKTDWQRSVQQPQNGGGTVHRLTLRDMTKLAGGEFERPLMSAGSEKPRLHRSVKLKYEKDPSYRPPQLGQGFDGFEIVDSPATE